MLSGPVLYVWWQGEQGEGVLDVLPFLSLLLLLLVSLWVEERVAWRVGERVDDGCLGGGEEERGVVRGVRRRLHVVGQGHREELLNVVEHLQ